MAEGTDRYADAEVGDYDDLLDDESTDDAGVLGHVTGTRGDAGRTGTRGGAGRTGTSVVRSALVSLVATVVGLVAFQSVLPFDTVAGLLGVFAAGFGLGLVGSRRRYLELAGSGALVVGVGFLLDYLVLSLLGVGLPLVAFGAVLGAVAATGGHYLGRDLRDGLTRDL
ncbi:MAG: hypothetical protein ABEI96_11475 [Haloarculaceae archaeon]